MRFFLYSLLSSIIIATSCSKKSECPPTNIEKTELLGSWIDERPKENAFAGTRYDFTFYSDSFRLVLRQWSDAIDINCPLSDYREYVKGTYDFSTNNNLLSLSAIYTDSVFNEKTSGCYSIGPYHRDFKVVRKCNTLELDEIGNLATNMIIKLGR